MKQVLITSTSSNFITVTVGPGWYLLLIVFIKLQLNVVQIIIACFYYEYFDFTYCVFTEIFSCNLKMQVNYKTVSSHFFPGL